MSGVRTIYLVSSGEYSDYTVHCAFDTREAAEGYIAALQRAIDGIKGDRNYQLSATPQEGGLDVEELQCWSVVPVVQPAKDTSEGDYIDDPMTQFDLAEPPEA